MHAALENHARHNKLISAVEASAYDKTVARDMRLKWEAVEIVQNLPPEISGS